MSSPPSLLQYCYVMGGYHAAIKQMGGHTIQVWFWAYPCSRAVPRGPSPAHRDGDGVLMAAECADRTSCHERMPQSVSSITHTHTHACTHSHTHTHKSHAHTHKSHTHTVTYFPFTMPRKMIQFLRNPKL